MNQLMFLTQHVFGAALEVWRSYWKGSKDSHADMHSAGCNISTFRGRRRRRQRAVCRALNWFCRAF